MSLLLEISRCRIAQDYFAQPTAPNPCAQIIAGQGTQWPNFQLPEPWSGHLDQASILVLGSNPSYAPREEYPDPGWRDDQVRDFFIHRFQDGQKRWVKDGRYTLLKNGEHHDRAVRYWSVVRGYARVLLERANVEPGVDYVMAEVIHCKSKTEIGVSDAAEACVDRYLRRLIEQSGALVVLCLGRFARWAVRRAISIPDTDLVYPSKGVMVSSPVAVGTLSRRFVFLPHPNARTTHVLEKCLGLDGLRDMQRALIEWLPKALHSDGRRRGLSQAVE